MLCGLLAGCLPTLEDECSTDRDCAAGQICRAGVCAAPRTLMPDDGLPGAGGNRPDERADAGEPPPADASPDAGTPRDAAPPTCADDELRCDGRDDDCDGQVDEGLGVGTPCSVGQGLCVGRGELQCGPGGAVVCGAVAGVPTPEACDRFDNDCDGTADEEVMQACYSGPPDTAGVGACRAGTIGCADGTVTGCIAEVTPADEGEACDGVDQDCDGSLDEDAAGQPCYDGPEGELVAPATTCASGRTACAGDETVCEGARRPAPTDGCNGRNDDCDGAVDEDCTCQAGAPCAESDGVCVPGVQVCEGGALQACEGRVEAVDETCNGADDDCDGQTDEGTDQACAGESRGACDPGVRRCDAGVLQRACEDVVPPAAAERCDGRDDDCDGRVDEDFPQLRQPCGVGVGACARGGLFVCTADGGVACDATAGPTAVEVCNGEDDDCDGQTDEGTSVACWPVPGATQGQCRQGARACMGGALSETCAGGQGPVDEICDNGLDDDCDGAVDDGCVCAEGARQDCAAAPGLCNPGFQVCRDNAWGSCQGQVLGLPETCNGVNDDCDSRTDEGVGPRPCYSGEGEPRGTCAYGTQACVQGGWAACAGEVLPTDGDTCGGGDTDCDGVVDEDGVAQPGPCPLERPGLCAQGRRACVQGAELCVPDVEPVADGVCDGLDQDCDGFVDEAVAPTLGPATLTTVASANSGVDAARSAQAGALGVAFVEQTTGGQVSFVILPEQGEGTSLQRFGPAQVEDATIGRVAVTAVDFADDLLEQIGDLLGGAQRAPRFAVAYGVADAVHVAFPRPNAGNGAPPQIRASVGPGLTGFDIAFDGSLAAVVATRTQGPTSALRLRRVAPTVALSQEEIGLHEEPGVMELPSLAVGHVNGAPTYGVAWRGGDAGSRAISFARFSAAGALQQGPIVLSIPGPGTSAPDVAWAGDRFAVAYAQGSPSHVRLSLVSVDGDPPQHVDGIDGPGAPSGPPRVAAAGDVLRLAWVRLVGYPLQLRHVNLDGTLQTGPRRVTPDATLNTPFALVADGDADALAWVRAVSNDQSETELHVQAAAGTLLCAPD